MDTDLCRNAYGALSLEITSEYEFAPLDTKNHNFLPKAFLFLNLTKDGPFFSDLIYCSVKSYRYIQGLVV